MFLWTVNQNGNRTDESMSLRGEVAASGLFLVFQRLADHPFGFHRNLVLFREPTSQIDVPASFAAKGKILFRRGGHFEFFAARRAFGLAHRVPPPQPSLPKEFCPFLASYTARTLN